MTNLLTYFTGESNPSRKQWQRTIAGIPSWAAEPFSTFLKQQTEVVQMINLAVFGIGTLRAHALEVHLVLNQEGNSQEKLLLQRRYRDLQELERIGMVAHEELEKDFPLLHSLSLIIVFDQVRGVPDHIN